MGFGIKISQFIIYSSLFIVISSQDARTNQCELASSCSECTSKNPKCGWCSERNFEERGYSRCDTITQLKRNLCPEDKITYQRNFQRNVDDKQLGISSDRKIVQIKPQTVFLKLRPGVSYPLLFKVRQAKDYPVDLYYLMDLSNSMKDDKDKLAELGDLLAEHMANITSNFRLGFGSFVDKVIMPYTNTVPHKLIEPCYECAAPYGFKNHMALSLNTSMFSKEVNSAKVSGNLDAPEGGFDAIMQAIVCPDIGWRDQSRKLLVFSTDSNFHTAGDGKIGGIVTPNDGGCHMNRKGYYEASSYLDYPSVSQIDTKAQEHKVNIIFAVTASQLPTYNYIPDFVEGSTTGTLTSDSSNVVELIKDQYNKITSKVEIKDNAPSFIEVNYYSKCLGKFKKLTNKCGNLTVGDEVEFEAEIKVLKCPADPHDWNTYFEIYPVGLERLKVQLQIECQCECDKPKEKVRNSKVCANGNGTYSCGVCDCNPGRFGRYCECDRNDPTSRNEKNCYREGDDKPCSGKGECVCGNCQCYRPSITGTYCECDNLDCPIYQGLLCSGEENGICRCGECQCLKNRTGAKCECASDQECINPETKTICSGNGICECGTCICDESKYGFFTGKYCQVDPRENKKCEDFEECVLCEVHSLGPLSQYDNCKNCSEEMHIIVQEEVEVEDEEKETSCLYLIEEGEKEDCQMRFKAFFNGSMTIITAEEDLRCPDGIDMYAVIWGVIAALLVLLIGLLLLLLWKLWTRYQDRLAYAKFERETESAKWDTGGNPLFKAATSTFRNPTYGGKK